MAILVIEDEIDCREPLVDFLEMAGYKVVSVGNGQDAIAAVRRQEFELIFCDITMPGITGYNIIGEVKKNQGLNTPFVFVTAKATDADVLVGMRLGADDYIVKPYSLQRVLDIVCRFVQH